MAAGQRHASISLLWLFAAGLDPAEQDTGGDSREASLANLLYEQHNAGRRQAAAALLTGQQLPMQEPKAAAAHLWLFSADVDPGRHDANGDTLDVSLDKLLLSENECGRRKATALFKQAQSETPKPHFHSGEYAVGAIGHDDPTGVYELNQLNDLLACAG